MADSKPEQDFVAFVRASAHSTKRKADRAMVLFVALRLVLVIASASLPALTVLASKLATTYVAVLIAVLTGLDTQFKWGEEWRHFRSSQLTLERLLREFDYRKTALAAGRTVGAVKSDADNFEKFSSDVETLLQSEADAFFRFRITEWKSAEAS